MNGLGLRNWERDAGLPGSAGDEAIAALRPEQVLRLVSEHMLRPGAPLPTGASWTYARWKPGTSLCAGFQVDFPDGTQETVVTKRHLGDKSQRMSDRHASRPHPRTADGDDGWSSHLGPPLSVPEDLLYAWAAHDDRELPALRVVADMRRRSGLIRALGAFPGRAVRKRRSGAVLLRYRPERRAVLKLDLALRSTPDGAEGSERSRETVAARALPVSVAQRTQEARRACGPLPLSAQLLGHTGQTGLLLEEWLDVDVPAPDCFDHVARAGALIAALHGRPLPRGSIRRAAPRVDLTQLVPLLSWSPRLDELSRELHGGLAGPPGATCWTHGDFHPDQVAIERTTGESRLMDLDDLALREPAVDLASWIADGLVAGDSPSPGADADVAAVAEPLLEAYRLAGGHALDATRLASHVALQLVWRAAGVCRRLERGAEETAARLLTIARGVAPPGSVFR